MKEYDDPAIQTEGALSLAARHWSLQHVASGQPGQGVRIGPEVQWRETLSETKPGKYRFMRIDRPARFGVKRASFLLKLLKRLKKQRASAGRCPTSAIFGGRMSFAGSRGLARLHGQLSSVTGMCQQGYGFCGRPVVGKRLSCHPANSQEGKSASGRKARFVPDCCAEFFAAGYPRMPSAISDSGLRVLPASRLCLGPTKVCNAAYEIGRLAPVRRCRAPYACFE